MENRKGQIKQLFIERAKEIRQAQQLSQAQMADRLHISSRAYNDLEHGRSCLSTQTLLYFLMLLEEPARTEFLGELHDIMAAK